MNLLILHYHLHPGGVTKIIEAQISGLRKIAEELEIKVLCGNSDQQISIEDVGIASDSRMYYTDSHTARSDFNRKVSALVSFIRTNSKANTILHCHNPNLGKNPALSLAVYKLAEEGFPIINHCHDFAEDRPANKALMELSITEFTSLTPEQVFYPGFHRYHFIVLNLCDYDRMLQQGISPSRIHLIPNPVAEKKLNEAAGGHSKIEICSTLGFTPGKIICTYPVRAIGRKNLGEFILLAAFFGEIAHFAVTLPPRNPEELPLYNQWKTFCREMGIDVKFEAGEVVNYKELISISDFCITTSMREGFGMVYLEPWQSGTPVIGRELSCVTDDLKKKGLKFPRLYKTIWVFRREERIDFMDLGLDDQKLVITGIMKDERDRAKLVSDNPFLSTFLDNISREIISHNKNNSQIFFN